MSFKLTVQLRLHATRFGGIAADVLRKSPPSLSNTFQAYLGTFPFQGCSGLCDSFQYRLQRTRALVPRDFL